jgi:hypothetical protein
MSPSTPAHRHVHYRPPAITRQCRMAKAYSFSWITIDVCLAFFFFWSCGLSIVDFFSLLDLCHCFVYQWVEGIDHVLLRVRLGLPGHQTV